MTKLLQTTARYFPAQLSDLIEFSTGFLQVRDAGETRGITVFSFGGVLLRTSRSS